MSGGQSTSGNRVKIYAVTFALIALALLLAIASGFYWYFIPD
jgi:hypothetical protein